MRLLCLLLLACVAACSTVGPRENAFHGASMFADLTFKEINAVRAYLHNIQDLALSDAKNEMLRKNSILLIELHLPKKNRALRVLDHGHSKPPREARVIVQFGNQASPNITEYIVSPLPSPNSHRVKTFKSNRPINFESRPITSVEFDFLEKRLEEFLSKAHTLLFETTGGFSFTNCSERCLKYINVSPCGLGPTERRSWIMFMKSVEGFFLHPIGLEVLLNHHDLDPERWTIEKVWYNSMYFDSIEELVEQYDSGRIEKLKLSEHDDNDFYSTYKPRGHSNTATNVHGPKPVEPQGHRYRVVQNFVEYAGWSFAYRVRSSAGLQVYDLRFKGERIAYEIGLQEALAFYAGDTPAAMQTKYLDAGWAMGTSNFELAPGIDCPEMATFVDLYHYYDTDKPVQYKKALCIFEMNTGIPLRRHFDADHEGGFHFYAGVENTVLVLRTVSTVDNYDYIWDFVFYQNGVMEVKASATGYIQTSFFTPNGLNYGTKVHKHVLGKIHTHLIHFKVDLDVSGTENSFESVDVKLVNFTNPWSPENLIIQSKLQKTEHVTERSAAFKFGKKLPRYLQFTNPNKKNRWDHHKSYRIQFNSHANSILPKGWQEENGIAWARYPLAVTCHKDGEATSSSIYSQNNPWQPVVNFEDYIHNDEDIVNKDLVAWVTVGFLHIPHSEDVPNTATPGSSMGFFLRPFNFFDEDPSLSSLSAVIIRPDENGSVKVQRWTPEVVGHCVTDEPLTYNGTYAGV